MIDRAMRPHQKYSLNEIDNIGSFQWSAGFAGGFAFYAACNVVGFFLILLYDA
jgi:hypothetical protein